MRRLSGLTTYLGSITLGKRADLVILTADPEHVPADDLASLGVEVTMVDGEVVYP